MQDVEAADAVVILAVTVVHGVMGSMLRVSMIPEPRRQLLDEIAQKIPDAWLERAHPGLYTYGYDPDDQDSTHKGFANIAISTPHEASIMDALELLPCITRSIKTIGDGLKVFFESMPDQASLEKIFRGSFEHVISLGRRSRQIERIVPGCVPFMLIEPGTQEQTIERVRAERDAWVVSGFVIPGPECAFHEHVKEVMETRIKQAVLVCEARVVREYIRGLAHATAQLVGQERDRAQHDMQHLRSAFGVEDEPPPPIGWGTGMSLDA